MIIEKIRGEIDVIDREVVLLLEKRLQLVRRIGELKKQNDEAIAVPQREAEVLRRLLAASELPPQFIEELYSVIFHHAKQCQK